jgi:adenine C2-methylase RlmN of 23S rRNA A2503 and tRNA A37
MLTLKQRVYSKIDKTQKFLFMNSYNQTLEVSYIDKDDGKDIICVPTQCGCSQGCLFCHMTGSGVSTSDLRAGDIVVAVTEVMGILDLVKNKRPLLVSYMGCGEPLCNWKQTLISMTSLSLLFPLIRFALATILPVGHETEFIEMGRFVRGENLDLKVHLSLHFTNNDQRKRWLPSAGEIRPSLDLLEWYRDYTGNRIELHYTSIEGVNDRSLDVEVLNDLLSDREIPLKLLLFNPKEGLNAFPSPVDLLMALAAMGIQAESYTPPGRDIGASCGQFDLESYQK